ncbi:cell division protein FtsQ/DivIB [Psychroflexus sp. MES1-P1E]|jgi:cell division protein FtsQ|uniref:cell division protein FtsQ/DivIB n=1 Tax=Psychroflexus sp. MES1-P1E TaxID=2058320 RepID=UPI000C799F43|nr:cell division protein FtsQ [Psychroflexus sp. MES1-P1E]PKG42422.1 cell division protein FtsQ [Psychroflexus sp. MES1-P1E]
MKIFNLHSMRLILIVGVLFFLVGFANHRQKSKPVKSLQVEFMDASKLFITEVEIEQILKDMITANGDSLMDEKRLAIFESALDANEMIKSSEAYYSLDGKLSAKIFQREPIARIKDKDFYYLDSEGHAMPLSKNYSSRVPMVYGIQPKDLKEIYPLLMKIQGDDFFKKHIIAIRKKSKNHYVLNVRDREFLVNFGQISYLDKKLTNYKVFYLKALEYNKLDDYKRIDLQFGNQVVCTIK